MTYRKHVTNLTLAVVALVLFGFGCSSSNPGIVGGDAGIAQSFVLTDVNGNPLPNMFWSVTNGSGSTLTQHYGGLGSTLGFTDEDGDSCANPDAETPQTSNDTAGADGCSDDEGRIAFDCTDEFTLYVDDGEGNVFSKEMACEADDDDSPDEVKFDEIDEEDDPQDEAGHLVIYEAGLSVGALGDRSATDSRCAEHAPKTVDYENAHAFISYDDWDALLDMPDHLGFSPHVSIRSIYGTVIAENWADLFDGSIASTLAEAGVVEGAYWTGTLANGTFSGDSCNGWTQGGDFLSAVAYEETSGKHSASDSIYLDNGAWDCTEERYLLCIAPYAADEFDIK